MWGALSDGRTGLSFAIISAVILGSESRGTREHILLSQIRDFPFRHLPRRAGLQWRYSTAPPHGDYLKFTSCFLMFVLAYRLENTSSNNLVLSLSCKRLSLLR
jgi:hypothetical protein